MTRYARDGAAWAEGERVRRVVRRREAIFYAAAALRKASRIWILKDGEPVPTDRYGPLTRAEAHTVIQESFDAGQPYRDVADAAERTARTWALFEAAIRRAAHETYGVEFKEEDKR